MFLAWQCCSMIFAGQSDVLLWHIPSHTGFLSYLQECSFSQDHEKNRCGTDKHCMSFTALWVTFLGRFFFVTYITSMFLPWMMQWSSFLWGNIYEQQCHNPLVDSELPKSIEICSSLNEWLIFKLQGKPEVLREWGRVKVRLFILLVITVGSLRKCLYPVVAMCS